MDGSLHPSCSIISRNQGRVDVFSFAIYYINVRYSKEMLVNLSFDGELKLCFFDGGGVILSTFLKLMETIKKVLFFFLHGKI